MPPSKVTRPPTSQRMRQSALIDNPQQAHKVVSDGIASLEDKVGSKLSVPPLPSMVTGSKGGNAALASLISALAELGLIKDGTT